MWHFRCYDGSRKLDGIQKSPAKILVFRLPQESGEAQLPNNLFLTDIDAAMTASYMPQENAPQEGAFSWGM
jgi:hypothetical protein